MKVTPQKQARFGVTVEGFDLFSAADSDVIGLRRHVHREKIVLLRGGRLSLAAGAELGRRLGVVESGDAPPYRRGGICGLPVPAAGSGGPGWHADHQGTPNPPALALVHAQQVAARHRGTYFIDMGRAYARLPAALRRAAARTRAVHSPYRHGAVRGAPGRSAAGARGVIHPTVFTHPATGERVLYLSEGFTTALLDEAGTVLGPELLTALLAGTGQLDPAYRHENIHLQSLDEGELLLWDNRSLVHRTWPAPPPGGAQRRSR
ncbi:TauD/TfdA dioxygenase family protein [Streptomyces sp. NPDC059853]|uniref:TauD/TfdA dioxygenase family protein n=1 Tax=Streptomyces sp. NPDC059853 TaxID=3346973 RepID=UPI003655FB0B